MSWRRLDAVEILTARQVKFKRAPLSSGARNLMAKFNEHWALWAQCSVGRAKVEIFKTRLQLRRSIYRPSPASARRL